MYMILFCDTYWQLDEHTTEVVTHRGFNILSQFITLPRGDRGQSAYGARPPHGFNFFTIICLVIPEKYDTVAHPAIHHRRKYEACKSKTETLRDENAFLELKVKTTNFDLFQIYKLFSAICKTFIVPKYSVYIIVSECVLLITLFAT